MRQTSKQHLLSMQDHHVLLFCISGKVYLLLTLSVNNDPKSTTVINKYAVSELCITQPDILATMQKGLVNI